MAALFAGLLIGIVIGRLICLYIDRRYSRG